MAELINIKLSDEALALLRSVQRVPERVMQEIVKAMDKQNQLTVSHIQVKYLSFGRGGPSSPIGLRVQSNRYRQSLWSPAAVIQGQQVVSGIGSNVKNNGVSYPAVHEFGATIKPHKIKAKGKALAFSIGGRLILRKSVNHPGMTLSARAPIQRGIKDRLSAYSKALSQAVVTTWEGGPA